MGFASSEVMLVNSRIYSGYFIMKSSVTNDSIWLREFLGGPQSKALKLRSQEQGSASLWERIWNLKLKKTESKLIISHPFLIFVNGVKCYHYYHSHKVMELFFSPYFS